MTRVFLFMATNDSVGIISWKLVKRLSLVCKNLRVAIGAAYKLIEQLGGGNTDVQLVHLHV